MHPKRRGSTESSSPSKRSASRNAPLQQQVESTTSGAMIDPDIASIKDALQAGQYNVVIAQTSLAIRHQPHDADDLIELRALAFERKAQTDLELRDALLLTQVRPRSARGYLRAAKLYSLQGKQGKAIEILKTGYSVVEEQHTLFLQQIVNVNAQLQRRIDFIVQSPYDILCNILGHIDIDTVLNCANVSRAWRSRLLHCPVPWRIVKITSYRRWDNWGLLGKYLPVVSRYIEQVTIESKARLMPQYLELLTLHDFSRLRSLHIFDDSREGRDISSTLYAVLPAVAQTLTELHIRMRFTLTISMSRILSICRNLTAINLFVRQIWEAYQSFSLPHITALTSVSLLAQDGIRNPSNFQTLFQCSPHLRSFSLHYCEADITPFIADHCPNLKAIRTSLVNLDDVPHYYNVQTPEMDNKGLELLVLGGIRSAVSLSTRLEASRHTLKYICLAPIGGSKSTAIDWQPLTRNVMPKVIYFYIWMERCPKAFRELLPAMLRCYPGLKTLRLESWYSIVSERASAPVLSQIYQTVMEMKCIERLGLVRIDIRSDAFVQLMLHFSTQSNHLRILEIRSCTGLTPAVLLQIAKIISLEDLRIGLLSAHEISPSVMKEFTQSLSQLPRLSALMLEDLELTTDAVKNLVKCRSLKRLWVHDVSISCEDADILDETIPEFHRFYTND